MTNLPISLIASKVIENLETTLKNSPTGVSYIGIKGYTNSSGEVSNIRINVGIDYAAIKEKDLKYLTELDIRKINVSNSVSEPKRSEAISKLKEAHEALLKAQITPNVNMSNGQKNAYTKLVGLPQIKVHNTSGKIFITAKVVSKTILVKGNYKKVNSRSLTIAKNAIKEGMQASKLRQYNLSSMNGMNVNKKTLEFISHTI